MEAMAWLREQGVVLQSAPGPVPNLAEHVAGDRIRGSWWGHPAGHEIFNVLEDLLASGGGRNPVDQRKGHPDPPPGVAGAGPTR